MKINKDSVDERHALKCKEVRDRIVREEREIGGLEYKLGRYERIDEGVRLGGDFNQLLASNNITNPNTMNNSNPTPMQFSNITLRSSTLRIQNHQQRLGTLL